MQDKATDAERNYREALKIYLELGDRREIAPLYQNLGSLLSQHERYEEAETCYRKALTIYLEAGNEHGVAAACHSLGNVDLRQRRYPEAERMYSRALSAYIKSGDRLGEASAYQGLGMIARDQQLYDQAEASYRKCLEICAEFGYRELASLVGTQLGTVLAKLERHSEATRMLINAAVIYRSDKGEWDIDDRRWLRRERSVLGSAAFSLLINTSVPSDLRKELSAAIEAVEDPEE